jgi:hypothetical protein
LGTFFATIKDSKVVEVHLYPNILGLMMQLGLMSPLQGE